MTTAKPVSNTDRVVTSSLTWDGWKNDGPLVLAVLIGAGVVAASFSVHGWARLALLLLGGILMWPLELLIFLVVLGGAIGGLLNPRPLLRERVALALFPVGLGVWLGSYTPGAPQELILTPACLAWAAYLLRGSRQPGTRRRAAACTVLIGIAAGATGLWLLAH